MASSDRERDGKLLKELSWSILKDTLVSSGTTVAAIFQSAFLYGYALFGFTYIKQERLHEEVKELAALSLCPQQPLLEYYLHGVGATSIAAFLFLLMLYTSWMYQDIGVPKSDDEETLNT